MLEGRMMVFVNSEGSISEGSESSSSSEEETSSMRACCDIFRDLWSVE